jgi:protein-S-isoprenylcysteine O-methyltransferase Ste14
LALFPGSWLGTPILPKLLLWARMRSRASLQFASPSMSLGTRRIYQQMALQEEFETLGERFFRWRSYLPLAMGALFILALLSRRHPVLAPNLERTWQFFCLLVSMAGLGIRFYTVGHAPRGTSGRNTRGQVADTLNTSGMYSLVRNPLYLGNFIIWLGLALLVGVWWCTVIMVLSFVIFYERIIFAEERFLRDKFGAAFVDWAAATPAMIPSLKHWRSPALPFSWKSALAREYSSFFAALASFTALAVIKDSWQAGRIMVDPTWLKVFMAGLIIYVGLRFLKKKTRLLSTVDR